MSVVMENTSTLGRRLEIRIPAAKVEEAITEEMKDFAKRVRVDGFSPGRPIPKHYLPTLEKKFGKEVRQKTVAKLIEVHLAKTLEEKALRVAGRPSIEKMIDVKNNEDLQCIITFEVFPEIQLKGFESLNITLLEAGIQEADIGKALEKLRDQLAEWIDVDRPANWKDRVIVDFTSTIEGKNYDKNSGENISVELGSQQFIEGFEGALVGTVANETREADLVFPETWRLEELAGKPVHFVIQVKKVQEKKIAEMNEEFAKKIGAENTEEAIRQKVASLLEKELEKNLHEHNKQEILTTLLKAHDVELPMSLVEQEMDVLHEELHRRLHDKAHTTCEHEGLEEKARERVALSLLLGEISKHYQIKPDQSKVHEKIQEIAHIFGNPALVEKFYNDSHELLAGVQNSVLIDQIVEFVKSKANITYQNSTFDEVVKLLA